MNGSGCWYRVVNAAGEVVLETQEIDAACVAADACDGTIWESDDWEVTPVAVDGWHRWDAADGGMLLG